LLTYERGGHMKIALCAEFLEEDVWESCLRTAAFPYKLEITECNSAGAFLPVLELKQFDLLVVVLNGAAGLEAVRKIRGKSPVTPLLWITDEDYSIFGYQYHVTSFLPRPVGDKELREAVMRCLGLGEGD